MLNAKRARKSKVPKKLILSLMIITAVSGTALCYRKEIGTKIASITGDKVETYNINDYVKDIYTDSNNEKFLPIVYNNKDENAMKDAVRAKFEMANIKIETMPDLIATGKKIVTKNTVDDKTTTYTIVIYGDVNSDGKVNVLDAQKIVKYLLYEGNQSYSLTKASRIAANVYDRSADIVNIHDAQRIVQFILGKTSIVDNIPASDISRDKEPPKVELIGESVIELEIGEKYIEQGAKVTDDMDPHARLIIYGSADTSKKDTYIIVYAGVDASGKSSTVERKVIVTEKRSPVFEFGIQRLVIEANDQAAFDELKTNKFYATAKEDPNNNTDISSKISVNSNKVDITKTGTYNIEFTVTNEQGRTTSTSRSLEVIDPVTDMTLSAVQPELTINEGEKLSIGRLYGIKVDVTKTIQTTSITMAVSTLNSDKDYKLETVTDEVTVSAGATTSTVEFKIKYQSPAYKVGNTKAAPIEKTLAPTVKVLGYITNFIEDTTGTTKRNGNIYEELVISRLKADDSKEQKLTSTTSTKLEYEVNVKPGETGNASTVKVRQSVVNGVLVTKFMAEDKGTYIVTIKASNDPKGIKFATQDIEVSAKEDLNWNDIKFEVKTNASGGISIGEFGLTSVSTPVDHKLVYCHQYTNPYTGAIVDKKVDATALLMNKVTFSGSKTNKTEPVDSKIKVSKVNGRGEALTDSTQGDETFASLRVEGQGQVIDGTRCIFYMWVDTENPEPDKYKIIPVNVTLKNKLEIISMKIDRIDNAEDTAITNMYLDDMDAKNGESYIKSATELTSGTSLNSQGKFFAIFRVNYVNEVYDIIKPKIGEIYTAPVDFKVSSGIEFLDNMYASLLNGKLSFVNRIGLYKISDDVYEYAGSGSENYTEYIGIAIKPYKSIANMPLTGGGVLTEESYMAYMDKIDKIEAKFSYYNGKYTAIKTINVDVIHKPIENTTNEEEETDARITQAELDEYKAYRENSMQKQIEKEKETASEKTTITATDTTYSINAKPQAVVVVPPKTDINEDDDEKIEDQNVEEKDEETEQPKEDETVKTQVEPAKPVGETPGQSELQEEKTDEENELKSKSEEDKPKEIKANSEL